MKRVYLAEDTPEDALLATAVLEKLGGVGVSHFNNGLELYRAVKLRPPDLVLLDIILPVLSGLAVSRLLKFDRRFETVPVLIASSITERDIEQTVKKVGADAYLLKPYDPIRLRDEASRLMGLSLT